MFALDPQDHIEFKNKNLPHLLSVYAITHH